MSLRADGRKPSDLRPIRFRRRFTRQAPGSVLTSMGVTTVLCSCTVEEGVPPFLRGSGKGWLTAEYAMLPACGGTRKPRDRAGKVDGRAVEIQRLIGRSLRSIVNLEALGERTIWLDCDVIESDGGTRTTAINGALVALVDGLTWLKKQPLPHAHPGKPEPKPLPPIKEILTDSISAVSVGLLEGQPLLDLNYPEDRDAEVDLNLVMTGAGQFVEIQAGGEEATFSQSQLDKLLAFGKEGVHSIRGLQKKALGASWPFGR
jgi:ribonuclease PH